MYLNNQSVGSDMISRGVGRKVNVALMLDANEMMLIKE